MNYGITGPVTVAAGTQATYVVCFPVYCISSSYSLSLPSDWAIIDTGSPVITTDTACVTYTVQIGAQDGTIVFTAACTGAEPTTFSLPVTSTVVSKTNVGICCDRYGVARLDTSLWNNITFNTITLTITFGNHADATAALGAYTFTSIANISVAACLANLVSQINAAAAANPGGNPEGISPASLISGTLAITSWPTPSDEYPCGITTNFAYGLLITCNHPSYVNFPNNLYTDFQNGGVLINCSPAPAVTGPFFVCTGQQQTVTLSFPDGIPYAYSIIPPTGWTLVGSSISSATTIQVTLIPNSDSGTLVVTYENNNGQQFTVNYPMINDCFISDCASKLMLS
jgi:hypothetical protein